ncbi:LPXTG cell wall anchor domain-containing protein [Planosporangium thailandense]|uniref:LPXTG cell wall anchor domain-containing protein n=1 Tax=Planosporangium thailandense TaxID=765197 RepID=A0ABX0XYM0_9ACTN|nr:LPXTG cell wall anchor domain-containing protein [Planosporangium thailandense]NJC71121.1 LPXTG cell wall anchor domain-containing protein [Planosporangium thailandense]
MRLLRSGILATAVGVACLSFATPAWATAGTHLSNTPMNNSHGDPKGANGTVKIDDVPVDDSIRNDPHVSCDFAVKFFNFDNDQHANIIFTLQPPTGKGTELLRRNNVLISKDPAGGGKPDPDEVFTFSASDLGLAAYTPHPKQGYHVKLTVEIIGAPGNGKHKVFWVGPCGAGQASPPPSSGGGSNGGGHDCDSDHNGNKGDDKDHDCNSGGGNNGGGNNGGGSGGGTTPSPSTQPSRPSTQPGQPSQPGAHPSSGSPTPVSLSGSLPTTGTTVAGVVALGLALVAAGVAVLAVRRRALKFKV